MRKIFLGVMAVLFIFLTACQTNDENEQDEVTVVFRHEVMNLLPYAFLAEWIDVPIENVTLNDDGSAQFIIPSEARSEFLGGLAESFETVADAFVEALMGLEHITIDENFQEFTFHVESIEFFASNNFLLPIFEYEFFNMGLMSYLYTTIAQIPINNGFVVYFYDMELGEIDPLYYNFLEDAGF